jgi:hypothetical protein
LRQQTFTGVAENTLRRNQHHAVSGESKCMGRFDRRFGSDPSAGNKFDNLAWIQCRGRIDQVSGFPIEQLRAFAQTVGQRGDDNRPQNLLRSGGPPHHVQAALMTQSMRHAGMSEYRGLPELRFIGAELVGNMKGSARSALVANLPYADLISVHKRSR